MVARMAIILWVLESKMAFWLYEQPHTSMLWLHPRMQQVIRALKVFRTHMDMGSFGAASPKPTHLWAPCPEVSRFSLPLPDREWESMVTKKVMPDGRIQVTGNQHLKNSQTYPREFGYATLRVWKTVPKREFPAERKAPCSVWSTPKDSWKDANLTEVFQFLSLGTFNV